MELKQIIEKYDYNFSDFYTNLWNDGMLDWFKDWNEPWTKERNCKCSSLGSPRKPC